ncbi:polyprenyl synthetase family protein [Streptomyces sp. NPDC050504]|uniref:polyprenyl synthetase family protein n=1 Tax=Streptomyces sp. NPDC050504 TaxID=3365618 RepID=UPI0037AD8244
MSASVAGIRVRSIVSRLEMREPELEERLFRDLERVESRLLACVAESGDPYLVEIVGHLVGSGGKRMRPLLALLGGEFGERAGPGTEGARDGVVEAGVVAELVHLASLYHDDVMDRATIRHGVPSVNARWGNGVAVMAGNWLIARATRLSAELGPEAVPLQATGSDRLVRGQMAELIGPAPGEDRLAHYVRVASDKSAALFSLALRLGAVQGGASEETGRALEEYGTQLGIAFQMTDDLLDVTAPAEASGKEQGKDLAVGVASLPVLLALSGSAEGPAGSGRAEADELRALLEAAPTDPAAREKALGLLRTSSAMERARELRDERLGLARSALEALPDVPARRALLALCAFVAVRTG